VVPIKTQARGATILPNFVGLIFQVHNGKIYNDVRITEDMVGHKLGEFSAYVRTCLRRGKGRSDTQQHKEALHVQADEEQVEGENGLHGNGANASLNDYTTREKSVKYLYTMALRIEEPTAVKRVQESQKPGISPQHPLFMSYACTLDWFHHAAFATNTS
jgi:ribosomal protein S19